MSNIFSNGLTRSFFQRNTKIKKKQNNYLCNPLNTQYKPNLKCNVPTDYEILLT